MRFSFPAVIAGLAAASTVAHSQESAESDASRAAAIIITATVSDGEAATQIQQTPGAVDIIAAEEFESTPVQHIKDILAYAPGVTVQPRMGDDARVSMRGSGLSRAYGTRGIAVLLDGVPMNTSDGLVDFFEIDPSAYDYVEVYRGANALRYGANSLGGAINLVTQTGRNADPLQARLDGGSFGYIKGQASTGGSSGALDWFLTGSYQSNDGYREHSQGNALRGNLNLGYLLSENVETRFYVTGASTNQRIPGEVSKAQALSNPRSANPVWVAQDQQRNVDSIRLSNKTTVQLAQTTLEFGAFYNYRHVDHPIFQYIDYTVDDYGAFLRAVDDRLLGGIRNRLIVGANLHNGTIDTQQYVNVDATKGALTVDMIDKPKNVSFYAGDSLYLTPEFALVVGLQFIHATRERTDYFLSNGDQSGRPSFDAWSPKIGLLWTDRSGIQLFANVSRSAEVPSYDANVIVSPDLEVQRATTYEVGTRGRSGGIGWDLSLYRSGLTDELQCLTTGPFAACSIINVESTVHQGIEAGIDASVPLGAHGQVIEIRAAYTYADFFFDDDPLYGDNELPGVPHHLLRAEALLRHPAGLFAGPNIEWVPGDYFADNANSLTVDPYTLLGVRMGYDPGKHWSAYIEGRNLADKTYISTVAIAGTADAASELFNPGTGRALFAGLQFEW